eukprot:jgi/Ulvmu1/12644/UM093_0037.1
MPENGAATTWDMKALLATLVGAPSNGDRWRLQGRYELQASHAYARCDCLAVDAVDTQQQREPVMITFYAARSAFEAAQKPYKSFMFKIMLRPVLAAVADADRTGHSTGHSTVGPLPPFVVTPRCRSMPQWAASPQGKSATTLVMAQQLEGYVRAVCKLHEVGQVHRALEPHSVVFCGEQHGWGFWDLRQAVRAGADCKIGAFLKYMPPEVMHAAECGSSSVPAATAADMWAIGILAYELLTRQPAFPGAYPCAFDAGPAANGTNGTAPAGTEPKPISLFAEGEGVGGGDGSADGGGDGLEEHARQGVRDALLGRVPLPWEDESPGAEARLACMGRFRESVLRCLSRGPKQRPSAKGLLKLWREVYLLQYQVR